MRASALLLLLSLLAVALPGQAQDAIHRCVDARGNPVFTDQPCATLQATSVQAPSTTAGASASPALPDLPMPMQSCAGTAAELRQRVIDAFALRDPNRLAGLMLWRGYGRAAVIGDIRSLGQLVRQPLLEIHFGNETDDDDPDAADAAGPPAAPAEDGLQLRTGGGIDERSTRFAITRQAGCLWLRYRG